jgi:hypothetical protein
MATEISEAAAERPIVAAMRAKLESNIESSSDTAE